ncbi:hypothetical protein MJO47_10040 [Desulfuromonas sp. KJ2020]|uniref:hypothetical protein n=1 Tax=Desulfuromonas sp. KJ2020 TaxID=2919173 RepID=UPI0020A71885|nr:hypothetical protein [Desulfuromonas sp. KJ2020]MCP3177439.1 hypothetical protein [Desulfuromonas sp. KJ2020]
MNGGWIKFYRALLSDPVWTTATADQKAVLVAILLSASHESRQWAWEGRKFEIQPGQFVTSLSSLASKAGVSVKSVRSAIARFEKLNFLANKSAKTGRIISVINWRSYQGSAEEPGNEVGNDQAKTGQLSRSKEGKKEKNILPDALRLSGRLAELIFANNPNNKLLGPERKEGSVERWSDDIDKMLRLDKRSQEEVEAVIEWCQADTFWRCNILSGVKLREKFDTLLLQMQRDGEKNRGGVVAIATAGRRVF